jgi:hypothetical protein
MKNSKSLNNIFLRGVCLKIILIGLFILTGCGKQAEISKEVKKKFNPSEYVVLTNLNLSNIQPSRHKELIDELNLQPCKCPDCTPGISLAQCVSTNSYCSYSSAEAGKIIKTFQKAHYVNKKLTFSIWDASRSGDINGIFRHLVRNTPVDLENVKGDTSLSLSLKSDNYESSVFLILSGAELDWDDKSGITPAMILEEKEWSNIINENKIKYNNKFTAPIYKILNQIIHEVNWNLEKIKLLSIKFEEWPDISLGENTKSAQLQVIVKGIVIHLNYNNKDYELKLFYDTDVKYIKLIELQSGKIIFNGDLDL